MDLAGGASLQGDNEFPRSSQVEVARGRSRKVRERSVDRQVRLSEGGGKGNRGWEEFLLRRSRVGSILEAQALVLPKLELSV